MADPKEEMRIRKGSVRPVNERIAKLREESVNKEVKISTERARLITEFYMNSGEHPAPIKRALAFKYLMENVSIPVEEGQLIVGMRGTGPKEVPTYPEVCCHDRDDLELLNTRENNPYRSDDTEWYHREIRGYWEGKSVRDEIFRRMSDEWLDAYEGGIFTEFMEQRVPGHTAGGERIFRKGLREIIRDIEGKPEDNNELEAMKIAAEAMITYAERYAEKLERMAQKEKNEKRREELKRMSEICRKVPAHPPETFWEALQHYWFIHVGIVTESNPWDSFSPGRLDQHLYSFYEKDREVSKELLEAFWLKFNNQPAPPKTGVTAHESNTYNDFAKINIGGLKEDGSSGVNELSYLLLEVLGEMRTLQPNTAVLISMNTENELMDRALEAVGPGFGEPPFFNHDLTVKMLERQGKSPEDARCGGVSGCVESGAFGKECYILTGYINLPKVLEIALNNGTDPMSGKKIGVETGEPSDMNFSEIYEAFLEQLKHFVRIKIRGNDVIEKIYHEKLPVPFLSLWIEDCVDSGKDYNCGGARYNTQYVQIVGLGTIADSLASVEHNIFREKRYSMEQLIKALESDFKNDEKMRQYLINRTPKYGNDDDLADHIAVSVFNHCIEMVEGYPPSHVRKASRRVYGLPTTVHVYFGSMCGATPDGRHAGKPLSEGISPVQGMDRKGIGAVFRSVGKLDHFKSGGTLLNQKLAPDLLKDDKVRIKLRDLMKAYFRMGSHHVQYNAVSPELLREAQNDPDEYRDLMVRVAGYSDHFVNLPKGLQDEIIARTEQT